MSLGLHFFGNADGISRPVSLRQKMMVKPGESASATSILISFPGSSRRTSKCLPFLLFLFLNRPRLWGIIRSSGSYVLLSFRECVR
jgi:hypothetical protein